MDHAVGWLTENWFGVVTAIVGIWVSWRLRPHPSVAVRVRGFDRQSWKDQTFKVTIKNKGQERVTADTFLEPIRH